MIATEIAPLKNFFDGRFLSDINKQAVPVDSRQKQMAVPAYLLAEESRFTPGLELQDWLEAECNVLERFP